MNNPVGPSPQDLAAREHRFALLKHTSLPIWVFDVDQSCVHWANVAALQMWRSPSLQEICARDMGSDMSTSVAKRLRQFQSDFIQHNAAFSEQWTIYPRGIPLAMNVQIRGIHLPDDRMAMLCESRIIEPEKPDSLRSVEALLHTAVMISLYNHAGEVLYRNPAARESVPNLTMRLDQRITDRAALDQVLQTAAIHGEATITLNVKTAAGPRWHEMSVRQCHDAVTGDEALLVSEVDVSAIKQAQAHSNYLAKHDSLTGLPNRTHVMQRFEDAIAEIGESQNEAALIYIDLDHFKDINDSLGHAAGDELLIQISKRLRGITRSTDMVARLGGDEFLILMVAQNIRHEVSLVRERLSATVAQPMDIYGTEVMVTPSVGVSIYPHHGKDMDTLMRNADLAMYSAKESGRNALTIYESHMTQQVQARMELESDLRHALANHEFEVYYQPRVSVCTGELVGAEALVRWNHPTRGLVLPGEFISRCESTGMIAPLGDFVFRQAALQQKQWARAGFNLLISVNLSPKQFRDPELLTRMAQIVASTDCQPEYLELELTESMLLGKDSPTHNVLTTIRKMGFSLSVDDFGTGYSNLAYLNKFPIQALKIDKTFVQDIEANRPLAELIVSMCRLMKLHIVAEGVETPAQLAWVQSQGIEQYQGYLYAKPMAVEAFNRLLARDLAPACGTHAT